MKPTFLILFVSVLSFLGGCRKKTNPTPQLVSGKAFILPNDSVIQVFKEKPRPAWAAKKYSYKPSTTRHWDLIHTRLDVSFDWEKQHLLGKATLTLIPYYYPQNDLVLDSKGLEVRSVNCFKGKLLINSTFKTDGLKLTINFENSIFKNQEVLVEIEYIAKPNELPAGGSNAITNHKGLFFINPTGKEEGKPRQIWTQGEPESASCWFPTLDSPNQRCTQEMHITVENQYKTLSNGTLIFSHEAQKGLRTDVFEMKLPHSPYLFMLAVGQFSVVPDKWRNTPLNYWVEPKYERLAKKIFGNTPRMIEHFSNKLGVPFPWPKYDQIVVRDFVSGAMENTSASVFMEALQSSEKELEDKDWDDIIAHELFHQWFGDLVTLESWANLPLNESFANYSQYLWDEYNLSTDDADYQASKERQIYFFEASRKQEPLIRYYHNKPDDMFDSHSYAKGGRILHMLRNWVGDEAFFESLHRYLVANAYKSTEIHQLRMAFEEVTGQDLNWFFNQWFLSAGHPDLSVKTSFKEGKLNIYTEQQQDTAYTPLYRLPVKVEIWSKGDCQVFDLDIRNSSDTFSLPVATAPDAIIWDPEYQLLGNVDINLTRTELVNQSQLASKAILRNEALAKLKNEYPDYKDARRAFVRALDDSFWGNRQLALEAIGSLDSSFQKAQLEKIKTIAVSDPKAFVRAAAIKILGSLQFADKKQVLEKGVSDKSLSASMVAYKSYLKEKYPDCDSKIKALQNSEEEAYQYVLAEYYATNQANDSFDWFTKTLSKSSLSDSYELILQFGRLLDKSHDSLKVNQGIDLLFNIAKTRKKAEVVIGCYQVLKNFKTWPGVVTKRKELKDLYSKEDFGEVLEYLE